MSKNKRAPAGIGITAFAITFLALLILTLGFDTVDASHLGVMNRFGVILGVMQPGMRWTKPPTQAAQRTENKEYNKWQRAWQKVPNKKK
jgi:hypothetical protein